MPSITMPQLGESVTEGTIGRWLKQPGDRVGRDEPIVEVITDKVNAEIPAPAAGILERISAPEGTIVAVGQEIAFVATEADRQAAVAAPAASTGATVAAPVPPASALVMATDEGDGEGPRSSPLVRKLAREHGLDLRTIKGTGSGGRVTHEDVEAYLRDRPAASAGGRAVSDLPAASESGSVGALTAEPVGAHGRAPLQPSARAAGISHPATVSAEPTGQYSAPTAPTTGDERLALSPMRRTIAQRMVQSAREIPHAWLAIEADVTGLVRLREEIKERFRRAEGVDLTYLPFAMKAAVEALRELPIVNSTWKDDQIILKRDVNLGVAVALDDGLVVPVLRNADQLSVTGLARALADVVARARSGKLTVADVDSGTFTVNNTGAFGSIVSQPIINYPQAGIMNVEAIVKRPVVIDDAIAIRSIVNLCLSFDHRILDGATAGRFLQSVRRRLEAWGPGSSI
jgi:2-oxoisovalerate dehydrogenase E2 component (dihydrolipoyl transacylase)